jgi:hypothetical protein
VLLETLKPILVPRLDGTAEMAICEDGFTSWPEEILLGGLV